MSDRTRRPVHLHRAGVSVVLAPARSGVPVLLHWGAAIEGPLDDLLEASTPGQSHSSLDQPRWRGVLGLATTGFTGLPGLSGLRPGRTSGPWSPLLTDWTWEVDDPADGSGSGPGVGSGDASVRLSSRDAEAGWDVVVELELTAEGVVRTRTSVTNAVEPGADGTADVLVLDQVRNALPVSPHATELLDLTGRWCRERSPQRRPWLLGTHLREGRHGRTGHDATLLMAVGRPGFGFGHGEVWATHVAWSGDHTAYAERTPEGDCLLGGGELLGPGEVVLGPGESYTSPWLMGVHARDGLDGASARLHDWLRRTTPLTGPRPVLVNTWEAVYFDHDLDRLVELADAAAEVGVERFVLDDGWFRGRRDDRAGLGDWTVDTDVWPDGLHPLVEQVHARGMDFGLWVEPEMVNLDSDLVRAHPDWVLRGREALPPTWRYQQVLDLQVPEAYAHVRDALLAVLAEYPVAFVKWDHNRDIVDGAHAGRPGVHGQTRAFYRLLDELHTAHPDLEIESCASGGGRIDAEVLTRTQRVWPSDTIDALERQRIQRWTSLLVPPERLGTHLGGPAAHTTGRTHSLGFRAATALLGHFGIEWDLRDLDAAGRRQVATWVDLHKRVRPLLPTGRTVRGDHADPQVMLHGIVAADAAEAWYVVATTDSVATQAPAALLLPGLDPARSYRVSDETPDDAGQHVGGLGRTWLDGPGVVLSGSVLAGVGLKLPSTAPETARVLRAVATG